MAPAMPKIFDNNQAIKEFNSTGIHPRAVRIAGEEPIGGQKMSGVGVGMEGGEGVGEGVRVGVEVAVGKGVIVG